jgi:putative transposase
MPHYRRAIVPGGTFFFTINLANRRSALLVEHIGLLRAAYGTVTRESPVETLAICILPDHLHALWRLPHAEADFSTRWQRIKARFSQPLATSVQRSASKRRQREKGIWQRRFWEHQIRDEIDLQRHVDYIHYNPVKHGLVKRICDWPYSSFHRWVRKGTLPLDWAGSGSEGVGIDVGE